MITFLYRCAYHLINMAMLVTPQDTLAYLKREPRLYRIYRRFSRW